MAIYRNELKLGTISYYEFNSEQYNFIGILPLALSYIYVANDNEVFFRFMNRIQMENISESQIVNLMTLIYLINLKLVFL